MRKISSQYITCYKVGHVINTFTCYKVGHVCNQKKKARPCYPIFTRVMLNSVPGALVKHAKNGNKRQN
jgi:hypothetical protein